MESGGSKSKGDIRRGYQNIRKGNPGIPISSIDPSNTGESRQKGVIIEGSEGRVLYGTVVS
jgi:hypothetical protein